MSCAHRPEGVARVRCVAEALQNARPSAWSRPRMPSKRRTVLQLPSAAMTGEDEGMWSYASIDWPADPLALSDWENLDLHESLRPEVVEGQLTIQPPRTADHQLQVMEVVEQLKESSGGDGREVTFGIALILERDPLTLRIPDVMVFRSDPAPDRNATSIDASAVELVIEITETGSRSIDRVLKR